MYASYNKFHHNVYRDATIVTSLDTFTSLLAGVTIFGILGHLAHVMGSDDIASVIKGGSNVAFISYPDAIARLEFTPQVLICNYFNDFTLILNNNFHSYQIFSILFFFMLFILGIGSNIAMCSCVVTAIRDKFPHIQIWQAVLLVATVGFTIGLAYVTPV